MPSGRETSTSKKPPLMEQRKTFQPPWVKDGGTQLKSVRRDSTKDDKTSEPTTQANPLANIQLRKTTVPTKEVQENGTKESSSSSTFQRPQLKKVPKKQESIQRKDSQDEDDLIIKDKFKIPQLKPVPPKEETVRKKENKLPETVQLRKTPLIQRQPSLKDDEIDRAVPATRNALVREQSMRKLHPPPPMPPAPPPAPKMPAMDREPLSRQKMEKLEQLKKSPKARPDWTSVLKEIEGSKKLKHVETNDRSQPLLPDTKDEHFLYESEKPNVHNELLKQIEGGLKLRKVKTNDRSKPVLEGLRKFRRQMTIEEQIQKSQSMASMPPEEIIQDEVDEMDDIDKVRDDLQSTKQMLALELRNKEAQIRENKRLMAKIQSLEAELEKNNNNGNNEKTSNNTKGDDKLIQSLKKDAQLAQKTTKDMEKKYTEMAGKFDTIKIEYDDMKKQNQILEKKLQEAISGKRHSLSKSTSNMANGTKAESIESETSEEESNDDNDDEDNEEKREKRMARDIKHLHNKLRNYKNKQDNAKKERLALKEILKKHQQEMKDEKKKYKSLKKEVDKMAALMKESEEEDDDSDDDDDDDDDDDEDESSEEETESDEDSSEESDSDDDQPNDKMKTNLTKRVERHEKILAALKKGNFMLKTNAERLQDDLNKQKEETAGLQEDLDSVLSELG